MKQEIFTTISVDDWHGFEIDGVQYDLNLYADEDNNIQANIYRCTKNADDTWSTDTETKENTILETVSDIDIEIDTKENNHNKEQE